MKVTKETASDLFKELLKQMINEAPSMGARFSTARKVR